MPTLKAYNKKGPHIKEACNKKKLFSVNKTLKLKRQIIRPATKIDSYFKRPATKKQNAVLKKPTES